MSQVTTRLKDAIEEVYGTSMSPQDYNHPYGSVTFQGVTYGRLPLLTDPERIGLGTYPIFHSDYRPILNGKILDEYWNREIGVETVDEFMLVIRRKMDQIMPYYNKLYESELIEYSALSTMDIHSVSTSHMDGVEESASNVESNSNTKAGSRAVNSQTPQTQLRGNGDYATSAADTNSESDVNGESTSANNASNSTDSNSDNRVTGYQGAASDLIMKYRQSLINIDTMILSDIEDCFMLVLSTYDSFSQNERFFF